MLELGNALGFLIGPLLVPNPPETKALDGVATSTPLSLPETTNIWKNQTNTISNRSFSEYPEVDTITMREDIMLLMYSRKPFTILFIYQALEGKLALNIFLDIPAYYIQLQSEKKA